MSAIESGLDNDYREMRLDDLDEVSANERRSYSFPWSRGVLEDCIRGRYECWVLEDGGNIIGHGIVSHILDETHLLNLCISPEFQGKGLGRNFLQFLVARAIKHGSTVFYLEVRVSNTSAIQLYFSEGFNEVGIRPGYYPNGNEREDGMLMTLQLTVDNYV